MVTAQPFFSIVIPTRNRYETLQFALQTVLKQTFSSFELIVSDNSDAASLDRLDTIKASLQDPRVRYVRPSSVLPMSDHWEFALSHASGEYVIVFGDDDGLVAGALDDIHRIIQKTEAPLVCWLRVEYSWPDRLPADHANLLVMPYAGKTGMIDAEKFIRQIITCNEDYRSLPMLYNSAVSRKLIGTLKEKTGRIFNGVSPDIYSGYAFAHLTKKYILVSHPLSINGVSARSNGSAHLNNDNSSKAEFWELLKRSEIRWPTELPEIYTAYLGIVEPFIQLKRFFPELDSYISRKEIYRILIGRLNGTSEAEVEMMKEKILLSSKSDPSFHQWVKDRLRKSKPVILPPGSPSHYEDEIGFTGSHLVLDASKFGLANVDDVSLFVRNLYGKPKDLNFQKPVAMPLKTRLRKAAGMILRPV